MERAKQKVPPGSGKPKKALSPVSIRMDKALRKRLEAAASAKGIKFSQEVLGRIKSSFGHERKRLTDKDQALLGFRFLIETLANDVIGFWDNDRPRYSWRSNRFFFLAYKKAVADLFDALDPGGECNPPSEKEIKEDPVSRVFPESVRSFESPDLRGAFTTKMLWLRLMNADPNVDLAFLDEMPDGAALKGSIRSSNFTMKDAKNSLFPDIGGNS